MGNFGKFGGGGGMGNMQAMMKQAQELQKKMAAAQQELDEAEIEAASGGGMVTVKMSGKKDLIALKLDPKVVDPDDTEMLEDLIIAAINDAYKQVEALHEEKMGPLTGGMGLF